MKIQKLENCKSSIKNISFREKDRDRHYLWEFLKNQNKCITPQGSLLVKGQFNSINSSRPIRLLSCIGLVLLTTESALEGLTRPILCDIMLDILIDTV